MDLLRDEPHGGVVDIITHSRTLPSHCRHPTRCGAAATTGDTHEHGECYRDRDA